MDVFLIVALLLFTTFAVLVFILLGVHMLFHFIIPMVFYGAIFVKSNQKIVDAMVSLAQIQPGQKAVDLGSGDGRLVITLAQAGAKAYGYEINPLLVWLSRRNIRQAGLSNRAFIYWGNFWNKDFSEFDVVTIYGISYIMDKLEKKLMEELRVGAKVISNYFVFSNWKHSTRVDNIYLYFKSNSLK